MKRVTYPWRALIGLTILLFLFYSIGISSIYATLLTMDALYIIPVIGTTFLTFVIGTFNLRILIMPLGAQIPFTRLFRYSILSWSLGLFSPARAGEFALIYFLNKEGISIGEGMAISILDRLITLLILSSLSILGFLIFFTPKQALSVAIFIYVLLFLVLFFLISEGGRGILKQHVLKGYAEKFKGFSKSLSYYLKEQRSVLSINLILTTTKWVLNSLVVYIVFLAFGIKIPFLYVLLISAITVTVSLIPVSISGLGIREGGAIFLYSLLQIAPTNTFSVYLFLDILNYGVASTSIALGGGGPR